MLDFFKRKNKSKEDAKKTEVESKSVEPVEADPPITDNTLAESSAPAPSLFGRLKASLTKTRTKLASGLADLFLGKKTLDPNLMSQLEEQLLISDVGMEATQAIIESLTQGISRKTLQDPAAVFEALKQELEALLKPCSRPLLLDTADKPFVILMIGVNGAGKTTTIGKLTKLFQQQGKSVMLAAGDTFRAAAVEQLQVWGERHHVPVIAQHTGADSASVIFDALQSAQAKHIDVLIADTAGRLHTRDNLMAELKKIKRVLEKLNPNAPHEVLLVLDATTGQNGLKQAEVFQREIGVSGLALTKLDGTAKGGVIFAIAKKLGLPIRYIGVGEKADDLRTFEAHEFVSALFSMDETT